MNSCLIDTHTSIVLRYFIRMTYVQRSDVTVRTQLEPHKVYVFHSKVLHYNSVSYTGHFHPPNTVLSRSRWPRGLSPGSVAACLQGLWVRTPPRAWMSACCECCVLSGRFCCVRVSLVQRSPTECGVYNRVWSWHLDNREALPWPNGGCCAMNKKTEISKGTFVAGSK